MFKDKLIDFVYGFTGIDKELIRKNLMWVGEGEYALNCHKLSVYMGLPQYGPELARLIKENFKGK